MSFAQNLEDLLVTEGGAPKEVSENALRHDDQVEIEAILRSVVQCDGRWVLEQLFVPSRALLSRFLVAPAGQVDAVQIL